MSNNTIVIGNEKIKEKKDEKPVLDNISITGESTAPVTDQEYQEPVKEAPVQEPLYETVWGNDQSILRMLDEKQKADRRFYARAIYMQEIKCSTTLDNTSSEPVSLEEPIPFMVIDISMGGIGIISELEIATGTILLFKLSLDNIPYEVKYEVIYCFRNEGKFRAGLKIAEKDKQFIKHLKILVARLTLESTYGKRNEPAVQ